MVEADGGEGQVRGGCRKLVEHNLEVKSEGVLEVGRADTNQVQNHTVLDDAGPTVDVNQASGQSAPSGPPRQARRPGVHPVRFQ